MNEGDNRPVILVTGTGGQLGHELQGLSYTHNWKGFRFLLTTRDTLDITNKDHIGAFFGKHKIDFLINCAAYTGVDAAEEDKETATTVNTRAVEYLVEECASAGAGIIHVSTDYVFDGTGSVPYREEDPPNPLSVYGQSKFGGEKPVLEYERGIVVRSSWLYSPRGKNFFTTIHRLASERNNLNVVYDQVGTPTYARDLARVLLLMAGNNLSGKNTPGGIYHYSNEGVCSWYDFAFEIVNLTGEQCHITPVVTTEYPLPAARPPYSVLNKTKIRNTLSIDIPHWKESLRNCVNLLD